MMGELSMSRLIYLADCPGHKVLEGLKGKGEGIFVISGCLSCRYPGTVLWLDVFSVIVIKSMGSCKANQSINVL